MKKLLTILHAEDRLSPSALSLVKGGDGIINTCRLNLCKINYNACGSNYCQTNDGQCDTNSCEINCTSYCGSNCGSNCKGYLNPSINPGDSCTRELPRP